MKKFLAAAALTVAAYLVAWVLAGFPLQFNFEFSADGVAFAGIGGFFSAIGKGLKSFAKSTAGKIVIGSAAAAALAPLANYAGQGAAEQQRQLDAAQYQTIAANPAKPALATFGIAAAAFVGGIVLIKAISK